MGHFAWLILKRIGIFSRRHSIKEPRELSVGALQAENRLALHHPKLNCDRRVDNNLAGPEPVICRGAATERKKIMVRSGTAVSIDQLKRT
jgi:hypothetical protein